MPLYSRLGLGQIVGELRHRGRRDRSWKDREMGGKFMFVYHISTGSVFSLDHSGGVLSFYWL